MFFSNQPSAGFFQSKNRIVLTGIQPQCFFPTNQLLGFFQPKNRIVLVIVHESVLSTGGVPAMKPEATAIRFTDPDFLLKCEISAIWRRFPLFFAFYMLIVRHISTSGSFHLLT